MIASEAAAVLTLAATYDGRTVGEADAEAWASILADVSLPGALEAVQEHYRHETRRLMPADILSACTVNRNPWLG